MRIPSFKGYEDMVVRLSASWQPGFAHVAMRTPLATGGGGILPQQLPASVGEETGTVFGTFRLVLDDIR